MSTLAEQLETMLTTYLPEGWTLIPYTTTPDVLDRPLVMIDIKTIAPGPAQGVLQAGARVYILKPSLDDAARNEQTVDEAMPFVVDILSRVQAVQGIEASRGTFLDLFPAWDVTLTLFVPLVDDEPEPDPEPDPDPEEPEEA